METDEERKAKTEDGSYHTAQVGPGDGGKRRARLEHLSDNPIYTDLPRPIFN